MGRDISSNLQTILGGPRSAEYTVEITFPKNGPERLATAPLTIGANTYTNDVESVSEVRQTLENASDRVRIRLQNKDNVLGAYIADQPDEWKEAQAVIGRLYEDQQDLGLSEWQELFRGAIQKPDTDDFSVVFEVISDTVARGRIVASGTLAFACRHLFKDPKTCGYSGGEATCNHTLKSKLGCDGRANAHRFGGMESRYNPDQDVPGTGSNVPVPVPPTRCPRLDQWILIKSYWGTPFPTEVRLLKETDLVFNPLKGTFHRIRSLSIVRDVEIHRTMAANGSTCFSSGSHKIVTDEKDLDGTPLTEITRGDGVLTWKKGAMAPSRVSAMGPTGEMGDVMEIELEDGHIYAVGNGAGSILSHNLKNPYDTEEPPIN